MPEPLLVVGGTIAALVAADAVAQQGREVDLLVPGGRVAGGFLPLLRDGRRLDLGPRIIELGYDESPSASPPFSAYRPGPHGHRPFLAHIDRLVRELAGADLVPITAPQIQRAGTRAHDFVLGGDLVDLPLLLTDEEVLAVIRETTEIVERLGPEGLLGDPGALASMDLAMASQQTHGATFHDTVIAPLAAKVSGGGAAAVIAELRRKIWLPLLWPQSLLEAALGTLTYRPRRPMHTVLGGGMGALVERLLQRLDHSGAVTRHDVGAVRSLERSGPQTTVTFEDGAFWRAADVVLGVGADETFRLAGEHGSADRERGVFVWLDVARDDLGEVPSVLFVLDPDVPLFRVTENTGERGGHHTTLVCEMATDVAQDEAGALATVALEAVGLLGPGRGDTAEVVAVLAGPSFAAPSFANRERHGRGVAVLAAAPLPADVLGVEVFGADSFNEQVVQGMAAAERWS